MATKRKHKIAAVLMMISALWLVLRKKPATDLDLPEAQIEFIESFVDQAICAGRPKPDSERYVTVQKGGRLEVLNVKVGDTVTAGQIIGFVDKTLNASSLKSALSSFRLAQKDYSRMAGLASSGSASREEFDRAQSNLEVKRAELERVRQSLEDSILRATHSGRISVLVFHVGDKVPDGSRVAAVEAPGALQLPCRISSTVADMLPENSPVKWTDLESDPPKSVDVATLIAVTKGGAYVGLDRDVRLSSDAPEVMNFQGKRVQAQISLPPKTGVAKLPSDGVVKRTDGLYALMRKQDGHLAWIKVGVIRRDATNAYVTGIAPGSKMLRITSSLHEIEKSIAKNSEGKSSKG